MENIIQSISDDKYKKELDKKLEEYEKIISKEETVLELFPTNSMINYTIGVAYANVGEHEKALKLLEKAEVIRAQQAKATAAPAGLAIVSESGEENAEVEALIRARADAKKAKNFAEADRIRDELKAQGIEVTDVAGGARWKRI